MGFLEEEEEEDEAALFDDSPYLSYLSRVLSSMSSVDEILLGLVDVVQVQKIWRKKEEKQKKNGRQQKGKANPVPTPSSLSRITELSSASCCLAIADFSNRFRSHGAATGGSWSCCIGRVEDSRECTGT